VGEIYESKTIAANGVQNSLKMGGGSIVGNKVHVHIAGHPRFMWTCAIFTSTALHLATWHVSRTFGGYVCRTSQVLSLRIRVSKSNTTVFIHLYFSWFREHSHASLRKVCQKSAALLFGKSVKRCSGSAPQLNTIIPKAHYWTRSRDSSTNIPS